MLIVLLICIGIGKLRVASRLEIGGLILNLIVWFPPLDFPILLGEDCFSGDPGGEKLVEFKGESVVLPMVRLSRAVKGPLKWVVPDLS